MTAQIKKEDHRANNIETIEFRAREGAAGKSTSKARAELISAADTDMRSAVMQQAIAQSNPDERSNRIGELLVELGQLTPKEVRNILRRQRGGELEPFGRIAQQLGLSSNKDIKRALAIQKQRSGPLNPQGCWENKQIVSLNNRDSKTAEAIRTLRSRLMINSDQAAARPLAILSPDHQEGRSYLCANLAVAYAQAGRRTLLIDADLRRPNQHKIFGISNDIGFSSLLAKRADKNKEHPVYNIVDNLYLVPAGPKTTSPQEMLCRDFTGEWLDVVMDFFDVVLIDTPAAQHYADAELLAAWAGQAILVARRHVSRKADLEKLVKRIKTSDTKIRGVVVND
jgi:receptor protein-tyrosine kinase